MYVLVITSKKKNILLLLCGAVLLFFAVYRFIHAFIPGFEISLEHRLSLKLSYLVEMTSIYAAEPGESLVQASSIFGNSFKTETIHRHGLSDITFQYPETLMLGEIQNLGHEITVHINFKHNNNKAIGFFQVWNLSQPFDEFLNSSKKMSSMTFTEFSESSLKVQEMKGVMWEYTYITRTQDIKGVEIFIENGSEMYRFSIFVPKSDYKPVYKRIIMRMAKSLRVKNMVGAILLMCKQD